MIRKSVKDGNFIGQRVFIVNPLKDGPDFVEGTVIDQGPSPNDGEGETFDVNSMGIIWIVKHIYLEA